MEDTTISPEQRAFLTPVETLKEICLDEHHEYSWNEFRLNKQPETLKDFVDLSSKEDGEIDKNRIIWVREGAFVCLGDMWGLPQAYQNSRFELSLKSLPQNHTLDITLDIQSSTLEEAIACLDFLVGLQDTYYEWMQLRYSVPDHNEPPICPLPSRVLEKLILQNGNRLNRFSEVTFTSLIKAAF
jgi:hypothetical protein